jgi:L-fucose mutarotase
MSRRAKRVRHVPTLLGPGPLHPLDRFGFYATCREPDLAVCVATGDNRLNGNIMLTVG